MRLALVVIQFILALGLIAVIILQPGRSAGLGAIGGGTEFLFGRKGKGIGATLAKITPYLAGLFMLVTVLLTVVR
ncbi:MAG TPA: preprotein translocase subunit SecG [Firmicutes bacterium]|nr:preprotein translocase subunit SecG [Candidatus Fermentithermobacillaceae bacterium]